MFRFRIPSDELFLDFSSKVQNLTVFSIICMIRIRFFGPWELFPKGFSTARCRKVHYHPQTKKVCGSLVEERRRRRVAFEETAKRVLRYRQDSEDLKVSVTELQEQMALSEEAGVSIRQFAQQKREREEVCIASWARRNAQFKGLVELDKKRCQNMRQEVKLLSERQEILKGMVEDKIRLQSNGKVRRSDI